MDNFTTPGVYVQERQGLSLGIQSGQTAVPVFVGHFDPVQNTEGAGCVRVDSWQEFVARFSADAQTTFCINAAKGAPTRTGTHVGALSVRLFFENGGGPCYVLALNTFSEKALAAASEAIELCPEITLLCWCEHRKADEDKKVIAMLSNLTGVGQQGSMRSRFLLVDAVLGEDGKVVVPQVAGGAHAAAYFPALSTGYRYVQEIEAVKIEVSEPIKKGLGQGKDLTTIKALREACEKAREALAASANTVRTGLEALEPVLTQAGAKDSAHLLAPVQAAKLAFEQAVVAEAATAHLKEVFSELKNAPYTVDVFKDGTALTTLQTVDKALEAYVVARDGLLEGEKLQEAVRAQALRPVVLRASVAMAGVYARTDRERGVWKAPANVELSGVQALVSVRDTGVHEIRVDEHLNETLVAAKVNAIRAFSGRGVVVWGSRTMAAAQDLAWRYVPVRRLFDMVERDVQQALRSVVFEPNSQPTWEQVRGAVAGYLHRLWEDGALVGDTPAQAYFVHVGLGVTMSSEDVQLGKMVIKVGLAAVRPAEFIVLQLTQDMVGAMA